MNMDDKKIDELINKALQEEQALPEGLSRRLEKQIDTWASTEEIQVFACYPDADGTAGYASF